MKPYAPPPKKGSKQWIKNESIIAKNPTLRGARDNTEGFKKSSSIISGNSSQQYKDNYDKINWSKGKKGVKGSGNKDI